MKKRLLCVLVAATLLFGVLSGCGGGPSGSSKGSAKTDKGGNTGDPVAIMEARAKAVNDAINWELIGVEETVEAGLLFYSLTSLTKFNSSSREPHDYNPDKPLDYSVWYKMVKEHTKGIVSEDTYIPLLKDAVSAEVVSSDVIETDDLYVYYSPNERSESVRYRPWCYILVKGTDIVYLFTVTERWDKANYYEYEIASDLGELKYTGDDAEYIFTAEFWKAFAQTAKFVGDADEDFKNDVHIEISITTIDHRDGIDEDGNEIRVEIPYIEEWYADIEELHTEPLDPDSIYDGFEEFLENCDEEYGFLVIDDFGQGNPTMFFNNGLYKCAGGGEVTLIHDFSDICDGWKYILMDTDRTCLLFWLSNEEHPDSEEIKIVNLKTFEVEVEIYVKYNRNEDDSLEFSSGTINGAPADEETISAAINNCNIDTFLLSRDGGNDLDLDAAWTEYENRE